MPQHFERLEEFGDVESLFLEVPSGIFFYDGNCGFCKKSVQILMDLDKNNVLRFAPLQGDTAGIYLEEKDREDLKSSVYFDSKLCESHLNSDAVLKALQATDPQGFLKFFVSLAFLVPKPIRDFCYGIVANTRSFLAPTHCTVLSPLQREKILP
jgi:predicted DCC family thiol-disulfide oxidoreductase YuxK